MHLRWDPAPRGLFDVAVTLEVVEPPAVDELYFWALQVSFFEGGRHTGAAHLGLLAIASWFHREPRARERAEARFLVLVPAHDEEQVIATGLQAIMRDKRPRDSVL